MSIGENVRQIRQEQRYTQTEIARRCGVTPAAISGLEHGDFTPSTSLLARLARALDVSADALLKEAVPLAEASETEPAELMAPRPKVLRPRSLDELLYRAGLETRWFTLPDDDFGSWWLDVSFQEAKKRFWQIDAEYCIIATEAVAVIRGEPTVAPELRRPLREGLYKVFAKHWGAFAAAPGKEESEEEFHGRQSREEFRQFKRIDLEKAPEEVVAHAI